jgi:hypothetical protein
MNDAKPRPYATQYYNSCETNTFKRNMGLCMIAVGALTFFGGAWVKAPGTIIASTCGAWREELQLKQSNSKVNAVKYRYYRGAAHPDGSYDQDMWIYSQ